MCVWFFFFWRVQVLLHCEHFLGQALLFSDERGTGGGDMAEENLKGCYAKRQVHL